MVSIVNPDLKAVLDAADVAIAGTTKIDLRGGLRVGVDLGTAYTVLFAVDERGLPVAGAYRFADVVRDGVVLDYMGAVALVRDLKEQVEQRLGRSLDSAAVTIPPGVPVSDARAHGYVIEAAGLTCTAVVDEPTAANSVLRIRDGAVVDIGGGTTGIAIVRDGSVVATADEPTGGTHFTLVIAGANRIPFDEAEALKRDPGNHAQLFPLVRPVMEKVATIVSRHLAGHDVDRAVAGRVVVGGGWHRLSVAEIESVECTLTLADGTRRHGTATAVHGSPLRSLSWLLGKLHSWGRTLPAGSLVSSGTFMTPARATAGTYTASFTLVDDVSVTFAREPAVSRTTDVTGAEGAQA